MAYQTANNRRNAVGKVKGGKPKSQIEKWAKTLALDDTVNILDVSIKAPGASTHGAAKPRLGVQRNFSRLRPGATAGKTAVAPLDTTARAVRLFKRVLRQWVQKPAAQAPPAIPAQAAPASLDDLRPRLAPPPGSSGMEFVIGQWPGDESDEELAAAMEAVE